MLSWVIDRLRVARQIDEIVVATTESAADDEIEALCRQEQWKSFRGDETDVLDRYYRAARQFDADVVVRITSDCPLIDAGVTDLIIATFHAQVPPVDYASNCQQRTYPRGLDTEVFSMEALRRAWQEDKRGEWREHVTPYVYKTAGFRVTDVVNHVDYSALRWTVDTAEDLEFVRIIYGHFGHGHFNWRDAVEVVNANAQWREINALAVQKPAP